MSSKRKLKRRNQLAPLQQKVLAMGLGKEIELRPNQGSRESMSDALSNVIDIYRDTAHSKEMFEKLVTLGSIAWNACASKPEDGQKLLETFYAEVQVVRILKMPGSFLKN
jgi:hypothetical protein